MTAEETLALDAMRADKEIDSMMVDDYQRYLAISHAAMGDYMSTDSDATGYIPPIDPEEKTVRFSTYPEERPDVGVRPTSEPQKLLNELQGIVDNMAEGVTHGYGRALDILHELSGLFLNQK